MLVSILIPCFNAEHLVAEAIESALAQTWPDKEVIVVDDGSTDASLDVIRRFEGRIRWETGPNRGGNAARSRLLELSSGAWLQYLDADDYLRPEKVARQMAFACEHPDCDVIYSATISELMIDGRLSYKEYEFNGPCDPWILLAHWELPQTGGPLWRKKALQAVGGWRIDQPCCQEHELYFRLLAADSRFAHCEGCLAVYRRWNHGGTRVTSKLAQEVQRQRLLIMDRIESHLIARRELSAARRAAINDTRHATARTVWHYDRAWARRIIERIRASDSAYCPQGRDSSPPLYSFAYRLLGFEVAEAVASFRRTLTSIPRTRCG
jgi:glycosyltransferase involved in cell wall biosynthesis